MAEIEASTDLKVWYSSQEVKELIPADLVKSLFQRKKPKDYKLEY
jgi:hypothetical protein